MLVFLFEDFTDQSQLLMQLNKSTILPCFRCFSLCLVMQVVRKNSDAFRTCPYLGTLNKQKCCYFHFKILEFLFSLFQRS